MQKRVARSLDSIKIGATHNMLPGSHEELRIVPAEPKDIPLVLAFIRKLAEYERLSHEVVADETTLLQALFGKHPAAEVVLLYLGEEPAGYAVYFQTFSTFSGHKGIYLEDLFVEPAFRGTGVGTALFNYLARLAKQRGCGRLSWAVLDWNQPAIDFYRKLGGVPLDDWTAYELSGPELDRIAAANPR